MTGPALPLPPLRRITVSAWLLTPLVLPLAAQSAPERAEVRQIVTFLFQPGRSTDALAVYERDLRPRYAAAPALLRFRAYREAESPEPLDLIVVSSYAGMAGMDAANDAFRRQQQPGPSVFSLYGTLSAMTQSHHDQFVEMLAAMSDSVPATADGLTVFEYTRVVAGARDRYEALLRAQVRPFEKTRALYAWSEAGRLLISDGWDHLRLFGISSLGAWQEYQRQMRTAGFHRELDSLVAARKTIVVRQEGRLSVR